MDTALTIENIYKMLSSLSSSNKKWLADHLYEDIRVQKKYGKSGLSDEQLAKELEHAPDLDMNDYEPISEEQYKSLIHSSPINKSVVKWL